MMKEEGRQIMKAYIINLIKIVLGLGSFIYTTSVISTNLGIIEAWHEL